LTLWFYGKGCAGGGDGSSDACAVPVRSGSWLRGYGLGLHRVLALKALIAIGPVRGSVVD
jgi:hypothetical protein